MVFNTYAFTLLFFLSHFSGVYKAGVANDATNHYTITSELGGGICAWGWAFHLGAGSVPGDGISVLGDEISLLGFH